MMKNTIRLTAVAVALALLLTALFSFGAAYADESDQSATVYGGWLVLRSAPSFSGTVLSSYPSGTVVRITGKSGSWYAVITPDGRMGYMLGDYLRINGGGGGSVPGYTIMYVTSENGLNVRLRTGPGTGYSIIASYAPGAECTLLSRGDNWSRIQIGSYTGYMMTRFLTYAPTPSPQPTTHPGPGPQYRVYVTSRNGKGVNLRSGPSKGYPSIGFYSVGTPATMISYGNTWSQIFIGNRYGYMMTEFLTTSEPHGGSQPVPGSSYVVSANGRNVNLRMGPSTGSKAIAAFRVGTRLTVIARGTDWYFIEINGYYGYMMRQFIYDNVSPGSLIPGSVPQPATGTDVPD